jgi:hypothetical protein
MCTPETLVMTFRTLALAISSAFIIAASIESDNKPRFETMLFEKPLVGAWPKPRIFPPEFAIKARILEAPMSKPQIISEERITTSEF